MDVQIIDTLLYCIDSVWHTFLQATPEYLFVDVPNTRSLSMDAYGVTPIPPPTITATSNLYQSWFPPPNGPSSLIYTDQYKIYIYVYIHIIEVW